jgi:hypothetical protein
MEDRVGTICTGLKLYLYFPYLQDLVLYLSSKLPLLRATWTGSLGRVA